MVLSRSLRNLTLWGLPLTGLLLAFSSISAFALIAAFAAMYSVSKVGGSWGGSLRSGWRRNPLAFTAARAHSTITSARSATRAEPDECRSGAFVQKTLDTSLVEFNKFTKLGRSHTAERRDGVVGACEAQARQQGALP
jgi:hypothetical protein